MTDTEIQAATFSDVEGALQLRNIPHNKPSRAKRLIMKCPACGGRDSSNGLTATAIQKHGRLYLNCDNECLAGEILDGLHLGHLIYTVPKAAETIGAQHGSQLRIAYEFADDFKDRLIHVHGLGWYWWSGSRWVEDAGSKHARDLVPRTIRRVKEMAGADKDLITAAQRCETASGIAGVLTIAEAMPEFSVDVDDLDADPYMLNCANGTLDLNTFDLRRHNPDDLITKVTEAAYNEAAEGKTWDKFLPEVLPNDDVREYFRRVIGMSLIGLQEQHKLPLCTGTGANGKSSAIEAILYALGGYAMAADPHLLTEGKTSSVGQVDLMGTRLAVVSETDKGAQMAEATAKQLTGGDRIKARKLYQPLVEFMPSHTLLMVTNHPPKVSGDDEAMWRRLSVIRFDVVIPEDRRDGKLPQKLRLDAEAILAWAVQGLADYQAEGLNPPDAVLGATADYRGKSDHLGQFLDECCVTSSQIHNVKAGVLLAAWQRWAAAEDCAAMGRNTFNEAMRKRPGISLRKSHGESRFYGVRLKGEGDAE